MTNVRQNLRILWLFSLLLLASNLSAQNEIHFDESGYQSVLKRSKLERKPIFYFIYASWCSHCHKMEKEVFKDSLVASYMNENFICAWQDLEKGEGDFFKNKYKITEFPTFLFLDEKGKVLYHFNGEFKANDFISEVKNALILEKQLPYLEKQFYDDPSNGDKCLTFLVALKKGSERKELNPIAQRYFLTQTDNQLVNSTNWRIIANGVSDIKSRPFQFVLHHQKEFEAVSSPIRFQKKIVNIVAELLEPYTVNIDTLGYYKKRVIAKSIHLQKTDSLIFTYDIAISERDKNWASYKKITLESTEKYVWSDTKVLKEIATNYLQNFADMASFKYAIRLAQHSIDIKESYDGYILLAKLNQKTKNTKDAIKFVKKAKDWNTALGWKTKDADDLLSELITK